jgi:ribosomal protein S18 acetylase RimI-like enzyme
VSGILAQPWRHTTVRGAAAKDLAEIAELHAASWRVAYRGILPDAFLDGALIEDRMARWSGTLERMAPSDRLLIAESDGALLGFVAAWTSEALGCEGGFDLYINNLHVRPELRGQKLGEHLMRTLARTLADTGEVRAYLWLLDGNEPAHRFYRRLGGRDGDHRLAAMAGTTVGETRMVWDDFANLAARTAGSDR